MSASERKMSSAEWVAARREAQKFAHEDGRGREYTYADEGRIWHATETRTLCGWWFTVCRDDPDYRDEVWRWSTPDDRPTCPKCLAIMEED